MQEMRIAIKNLQNIKDTEVQMLKETLINLGRRAHREMWTQKDQNNLNLEETERRIGSAKVEAEVMKNAEIPGKIKGKRIL